MFVKLLIGRNAGAIVDMRADAAQAGLATGSCAKPSDEEMAAAGLPVTNGSAAVPEQMPDGYESRPNEDDGGVDVFGPDGSKLNVAPLRNQAQARDLARQHADAAAHAQQQAEGEAPPEIPEGWRDLAWADLRALTQAVAPDLRNPSKADAIGAIEAELVRRASAQ